MCDITQVQISNAPFPYLKIQEMYFDNDKKRREMIFNANASIMKVLERLLSSVVQWNRDKALHEDKMSACMKVFSTSLGPRPLSFINVDLNHMRFLNAWN